jgi:hypothetical protein
MRYFIRTPKVAEERVLGPYEAFEVLERAKQLHKAGIEFFVTDETGIVVVDEGVIKSSKFQ